MYRRFGVNHYSSVSQKEIENQICEASQDTRDNQETKTMRIKYLGKVSVNNIFNCQMCEQISKEQYVAKPNIPSLVDWSEMTICKNCARREIGSKNKKEWNRIHEEPISR